MKDHEVKLNRLFKAARRAPAEDNAGTTMPRHLLTRVLAHWRSRAADETARGLALLFRAAFACAAVVMFVAIAWSFGGLMENRENDEAVANFELRADVMP